MKKLKFLNTLAITLLIATTTISCNKDDDAIATTSGTHPNGIKILSATAKTVVASTYTFDGNPERTVTSIDIGEFNGDNVYVLNSNDQILISSNDDQEPDGEMVVLTLSTNEVYTGANFTVNENENSLVLTGQVSNPTNGSKNLSITIQESQIGAGTSTYTVNGDQVLLTGTLGTYTYNQILEINANHPSVKTIVLTTIAGSLNDDVNVETGRLIRTAGYSTHLKSDSEIYSGGVDLFCSGLTRTRETGSKIGVHSWCCYEGQTADQLPENSPGHNSQLAYFREMLGSTNGPNFYFFTINAAPFDGTHLMTDAEITQYQLITN